MAAGGSTTRRATQVESFGRTQAQCTSGAQMATSRCGAALTVAVGGRALVGAGPRPARSGGVRVRRGRAGDGDRGSRHADMGRGAVHARRLGVRRCGSRRLVAPPEQPDRRAHGGGGVRLAGGQPGEHRVRRAHRRGRDPGHRAAGHGRPPVARVSVGPGATGLVASHGRLRVRGDTRAPGTAVPVRPGPEPVPPARRGRPTRPPGVGGVDPAGSGRSGDGRHDHHPGPTVASSRSGAPTAFWVRSSPTASSPSSSFRSAPT